MFIRSHFDGGNCLNRSQVRNVSDHQVLLGLAQPIFILNNRNLSKSELTEKDAIAVGMKIATEAITNIRTVASLSK